MRVPPGSTKTGKGRHQIDTTGGTGTSCQRFGFAGITDQIKAVAQPLDGCTSHEDGALQRIGGFAVEPVTHRREQAIMGLHCLTGIHHHEAAGAIGAFHHARLKTGLPYQRRLLVPGNAGHRHRGAQQLGAGGSEFPGAVTHLRQYRRRNIKELQQCRIPGLFMDIEQQGA